MKLTEKYFDYLNEDGSDNELIEELGLVQEQGRATKYRKTTHSVAGVGAGAITAGVGLGLYAKGKKLTTKMAKELSKDPNTKELAKMLRKSPKLTAGFVAKKMGKWGAVGAAGWGAYRGVRAAFDKCTRRCGWYKINTPERQKCMNACKQKVLAKKNEDYYSDYK